MEGTEFGRYRLLDLLGRGGMGDVWKAYDTETDRVVAVKVLRADFVDDQEYKQRFRREARAAAGLNEPHVVPIHHYGDINGRLYVDMRLIQGVDLQSMLHAGALDPRRAVDIVGQVAAALHAAHRIGLVHRDVKPSNILIAEGDFAYLIDFGIARTAEEVGLTNTGTTIGTWAYMAPERFTTGAVDARSDVYALACVLYEALTGQLPYPGDSFQQQVAGHMMLPLPQPSALRGGLPMALDSVIAAGMAKDPRNRYPSTIELARAAKDALTAPTHRPWTEPKLVPQQHYYPPAQGAVRTGQAPWQPAPATNYTPWQPPLPPHHGPPAQDRPWWRRSAILASAVAAVVAIAIVGVFAVVGTGEDSTQASTTSSARERTTTTTTTSPEPPAPPIDALLLGIPEVNTILGTTGFVVDSSGGYLAEESADPVTPPECKSLTVLRNKAEYANTPVLQVRWQSLTTKDVSGPNVLEQNVVRVQSDSAAKAYLERQARAWGACQGKSVSSATEAGQRLTYDFTELVRRPDLITITNRTEAITCQHALGVRGEYVAEAFTCARPIADQAALVVMAILEKTTA